MMCMTCTNGSLHRSVLAFLVVDCHKFIALTGSTALATNPLASQTKKGGASGANAYGKMGKQLQETMFV